MVAFTKAVIFILILVALAFLLFYYNKDDSDMANRGNKGEQEISSKSLAENFDKELEKFRKEKEIEFKKGNIKELGEELKSLEQYDKGVRENLIQELEIYSRFRNEKIKILKEILKK